jgi:hypothetical protein
VESDLVDVLNTTVVLGWTVGLLIGDEELHTLA